VRKEESALGVMLGAFGQIPINDYMIGKMASGELRARRGATADRLRLRPPGL
jgi:hypothetical protein